MMYALEKPAGTQREGRRLIVTMQVDDTGGIVVQSCEVIGDTFRNRTSWSSAQDPEAVFQPAIVTAIKECLSGLTASGGVIALPNFLLETRQLLLGNANVIATRHDGGRLRVMLRFRTFVGSLSHVFRPHIDLVNGAHDAALELSDRIMFDISMPLLNFLSMDEMGGLLGAEDAERLVGQLTDQSHAIRFQIELIKRHMARLETSVPGAPPRAAALPIDLDAFIEGHSH